MQKGKRRVLEEYDIQAELVNGIQPAIAKPWKVLDWKKSPLPSPHYAAKTSFGRETVSVISDLSQGGFFGYVLYRLVLKTLSRDVRKGHLRMAGTCFKITQANT